MVEFGCAKSYHQQRVDSMVITQRNIQEAVEKAVRFLLKNDLFLLSNDSDEWSISHKFAEHLQQEFLDWHVDVEYNRDKDQVKTLDKEKIRPDIIVHIRNTDSNLLVIEVKKSNNLGSVELDRERLKKFTSRQGKHKYQFGLLVTFYVGNEYQKTPVYEYYQKEE
jgi:hypothetical protein